MRAIVIFSFLLLPFFGYGNYGFFSDCPAFITVGGTFFEVGNCSATPDPSFSGYSFGVVGVFALTYAEIQTYENSGDDVIGGTLYYRIWTGSPSGGFSSLSLSDVNLLGGGDEKRSANSNINLLAGLTGSTNYTLEIYYQATENPNNQFYHSNGGANYSLTFTTPVLMPVTLSQFTANSTSMSTHLTWATATETNNSHFEIQRSADAREWKALGEVKGAGTTQKPQQYEFTDVRPPAGLSYYRLRQVDFDGQYEYSPVVAVSRKGEGYSFAVFPNPASDRLQAVLPPGGEGAVVELYNGQGQRIRQQQLLSDSGREEVRLTGLLPGLYYLFILDGKGRQLGIQRFVKD